MNGADLGAVPDERFGVGINRSTGLQTFGEFQRPQTHAFFQPPYHPYIPTGFRSTTASSSRPQARTTTVLLAFLLAAVASICSRSRLGLALVLRPPLNHNRIFQPLPHGPRVRIRIVTMSDASKRTSGRKRKEVNYNEEKVIPALDEFSGDEEGKGAKKGRSTFIDPKIFPGRQPLPTRQKDGTYKFADHPEFRPNLSPKEVRCLVMGSCVYTTCAGGQASRGGGRRVRAGGSIPIH